ncbi:MAG: sugar phosphate isomerase/epimerase [Phycisphaerae bacterium]|jgi:sugar phosphate isomerase/epimerase
MQAQRHSRRTILAAGAAGAAAGLMHSARPAAGQAALASPAAPKADGVSIPGKSTDLPVTLKVSIAGYSFREFLDKPGKPGKMSLLDLADMAARWKIDAIEPTSYYFLREDDEFIYTLKRRVYLNGLEISGLPLGTNFCFPPGPELQKQLAEVRKWVDIGAKLGTPGMRIFAGRKDNRPRAEILKTMAPALREACDYAGAHGIFLAIENHGFMTETADDVLRIVEAVRHDWLGVNLDTGNFNGDAYAEMAKIAPLAVSCQVKALASSGPGKRGPVDLARVVQILRQARYRGYVTLEYEEKDPHRVVPELLGRIQEAIRA